MHCLTIVLMLPRYTGVRESMQKGAFSFWVKVSKMSVVERLVAHGRLDLRHDRRFLEERAARMLGMNRELH